MQSIAKALTRSFGLMLVGWIINAQAQEWAKQRPLTFVVAFTPGAATDTLARLIGQKLAESLGQAVVVDNRAGAGGNIGAQRVKSAVPDGYTFLMTSAAYAISPSLYANAGYDPLCCLAVYFTFHRHFYSGMYHREVG